MQALGQTQVVYGFDDANRLATITQGTQTVTLGYDIADRRTTLVLPNNINLTYAYNNASELTGITYKRGTTTLGIVNE